MSKRPTVKKRKSPETIEAWAAGKQHLKWPLIIILIVIFLIVVFVDLSSRWRG